MNGISMAMEYLRIYPFVRYAVIVGVLVSLAASLLGVTLVLKRFSFIGDGLSHVAFGAISIATVMHFTSYVQFTLPATILCAILILRTGRNSKINGDAVIAMLSVASLAVGYMIMNVFGASSNLSGDVCSNPLRIHIDPHIVGNRGEVHRNSGHGRCGDFHSLLQQAVCSNL